MNPLIFDPYDPEILKDPYPYFKRMRKEAPVYHVKNRDYWVLTRYTDIKAALHDHGTFSSAKGNAPEPVWMPAPIGVSSRSYQSAKDFTGCV